MNGCVVVCRHVEVSGGDTGLRPGGQAGVKKRTREPSPPLGGVDAECENLTFFIDAPRQEVAGRRGRSYEPSLGVGIEERGSERFFRPFRGPSLGLKLGDETQVFKRSASNLQGA